MIISVGSREAKVREWSMLCGGSWYCDYQKIINNRMEDYYEENIDYRSRTGRLNGCF
ncbi:MAG: hypothetical protein LUE24_08500 [Lachnospiraceae bacterium]|nr:hypothetical protein [Lachnospiraceae bacterium]